MQVEHNPISLRERTTILVLAGSMVHDNQTSGGDRLFVELSKRLDQNKYQIVVLTNSVGKKLWKYQNPDQVVLTVHSSFLEKFLGRKTLAIAYILRAIQILGRANGFPVSTSKPLVLYSSSDYLPDILAPFFLKIFNRRVTWISRVYHVIPFPTKRKGNALVNFLSFASQRICFQLMKRRADAIVALNPSVLNELKKLGFADDRLAVSGAGIDLARVHSITPSGAKVYDAAFLGRIHPNKGIFDLLEIWTSVVEKKRDARLAIIGGGDNSMIQQLLKRINEHHLQRNVEFFGFVPKDEDVFRILKSSKLFIFTDHENGWGLAVCEAMACGLPVIAYDLEIFGTVYNKGFVSVPIFETSRFARRLIQLLEDGNARSSLGQEALEQSQSFGWETIARDFSMLLDVIVRTNSVNQQKDPV